jgi:hypothetical protein
MRLRAPSTALVLLLAAGLLHAQDGPKRPDAYISARAPAVPQTFDWATAPVPATTPWGQAIDVPSTQLIRSWTTMPEYTNAMVDHLPEHPTVVSPTRHFGYPIGKPGVLHRVNEIYDYFGALAGSSPRVRFERLGETEEGNHLALVQVGSERNLARLDEIKRGLNALADPRGTSAAEAERLIQELPAVYTFYAGLHSTETGPPEMVMEMAYRLAVSDDPMIRTIRDSVVVFIVPVAEPDGRNRAVDWHRRHNANTFTEEDRVPGPPYWGKYIFHDNNRDGIQLSARLTQELVGLFNEWRYPLGHDLHESVPYLYVSTGTGPYNPNVDPIAVSEWQWMANKEVTDLTAEGDAGRLDARLLRRLVPGLPALGDQHPQLGGPLLRDVRQQRPEHHGARAGRDGDPHRVVPPEPAARLDALVDAQQHELHAERGALHPLHGGHQPPADHGAVLDEGEQLAEPGTRTRRPTPTWCRWTSSGAPTCSTC